MSYFIAIEFPKERAHPGLYMKEAVGKGLGWKMTEGFSTEAELRGISIVVELGLGRLPH